MDLVKRQNTDIIIVEEQPIMIPQQQPVQQITNIYNVTLAGPASWLAVLAEMPTSTVLAGALIIGVICATVATFAMIIASTVMQLGFYLLVAIALFLVAMVTLAAVAGR